jgi:serpin B
MNEAGTEAAAATSITMRTTSMPINVTDMTFDRPFVFFIWDNVAQIPLFIGNISNPAVN